LRIWLPQPMSDLVASSASRLGVALLHFQLVQLGFQHLHRAVAVGVLAALGLAGHHHAGRDVRDAHGGLGLVDVLAAGARRTVNVGLQVGRIDLDIDVVVDFRRHEHRREAGVAAVVRIERALAHQAVHADFGLQPAVGVIAFHAERRGFDAGHFAALTSISSVFQPRDSHQRRYMRSSISAQSCASVPPAPAWMSTNALAESILPENMRWNSSLPTWPRAWPRRNRVDGVFVAIGGGHFQQLAGIGEPARHAVDAADDGVEAGAFAAQFLRARRIVPDLGAFQFAAYFFQTLTLGGVVKGTP
jgi:hypothetical protein